MRSVYGTHDEGRGMHEAMLEKAREVGRLLGQTDEHKALRRAQERLNDDRDSVGRLNRLVELERDFAAKLQEGKEIPEAERSEYEEVASQLQASPVYQGIVAAQSNFDKLMHRVNEEMSKGMESAAQSNIIIP